MNDDLSPLFAPAPAGPSQDVRWRQGTVQTFNPITLQNTVDIGGTVVQDLPVLGVAEATSLVPGSVVGLLAIESTLGTVTYAILGRLVEPNTPAANAAVALLSSWITSQSITAQETTSSTSFGDLATFGPEVTFTVRNTGRVLLVVTSQMQQVTFVPATGEGGYFSIALSGANTQAAPHPDVFGQTALQVVGLGGGAAFALGNTVTVTRTLEGLNPGVTTATVKYRSVYGTPWDFGRRSLAVLAL